MASLIERAIGAAKLDPAAYEDVEADPTALGQAMTVVAIASISTGIGSGAASSGQHEVGLVAGILGALIGWFIWAATTWFVGTKMLPEPETKADLGELLRTTGFASSPGIAGILGAIPGVGAFILFAVSLWQLAAMVIAVRQALDYKSTGRAIGVCVVGFVIQMLVLFVVVGLVAGGIAALFGGHHPSTVAP